MSDRKPSPFPVLLNNDVCSLIQAAEDVYQIRFKNRAANAYLVRGKSRTIMIDVGLSSNYPALLECLDHLGCPPDKIDIVILSHEHLDHIGAAYHFNGRHTIIAAHRLAANKIMLRDDFSMLRKMFNEPNVPIDVDIWLEEGNLIDLGNFRLNVMYTPGHTSACISLFDHEFQDPVIRSRPVVRYTAGRCPDRDSKVACAAVGHRAAVRRARCAVELRADHAVGARPQQARRRLSIFHTFDRWASGLFARVGARPSVKA